MRSLAVMLGAISLVGTLAMFAVAFSGNEVEAKSPSGLELVASVNGCKIYRLETRSYRTMYVAASQTPHVACAITVP